MATSPGGSMLPPVSEAVSLCTPVAGEHGWEGAGSLESCLWVVGQQLVGHCVKRWMLCLIQYDSSYVLMFLYNK